MGNRGEFSSGGVSYVKVLPAPVEGLKGKIFYLLEDDNTYSMVKRNYVIVGNPIGDENAWEWQLLGGGGQAPIGDPTDAQFGSVTGIAGLQPTDKIVDAFDKVDTILEKLAPPKGWNLSQMTFALPTNNDARALAAGGSRDNVISSGTTVSMGVTNTSPQTAGMTNSTDSFFDGSSGTLTAQYWNGTAWVTGGTKSITGSDVGTTGNATTDVALTIGANVDPWATVSGKLGFWQNLHDVSVSRNFGTPDVDTQYKLKVIHSATGSVESEPFYFYTVTTTPTFPAANITAVNYTSNRMVSGVPSLATSDSVSISATMAGAVLKYIYSARNVALSMSCFTGKTSAYPAGVLTEGQTIAISDTMSPAANQYSEGVTTGNITGYNWLGNSNSAAMTKSGSAAITAIRIDTVSNTADSSIMKPGTGQYPATGYTTAVDHTIDLTTNEGMQLLSGGWRYPVLTDYGSVNGTTGPNYTGITGTRWFVKKITTGFSNTGFTLTIAGSGTWGISSGSITSGVQIYAKVETATGWVDANAPYDGISTPSADGDAAMVSGTQSTAMVKRVTFGSTVRSGDIYVRIGIPAGSDKVITNVTYSA